MMVDEELALSALKLQRADFVSRLPRWFLIVPVQNARQPSVRFRTVACEYVKELADAAHRVVESDGPPLKSPRWNRQAWTPTPLVKREGSPYSDRISIGRAPNVDVVIHSRFVSKLHAHIVLSEGENPVVTDVGSQNGTFVNGNSLLAGSRKAVSNGDILSLGQVHCEMATSDAVYYALRRKYLLLFAPTETAPDHADKKPSDKAKVP